MADDRTDPQYKLRMPADLKAQIEGAARVNKRSMNAEIVARLEESLKTQFTDEQKAKIQEEQRAIIEANGLLERYSSVSREFAIMSEQMSWIVNKMKSLEAALAEKGLRAPSQKKT